MAQVTATLGAEYLGALHAVAVVLVYLDITLADDVPEAGPARTGMELGSGREEVVATGGAGVDALLFVIDVLTGKGPLCTRLAQDPVLFLSE